MAVQWNGAQVIANQKAAATVGMTQSTETLLGHSRARAPFREGDLRRSGKSSQNDTGSGVEGAVSYNTPYAARQHEEVGWNHPLGGEPKYLENAQNDFADEFAQIMAHALRGGLE